MSVQESDEMSIEVIPTGAMLGAEIRGVDGSRPIPTETRQAILDAWHQNLVLLFRDQQLDIEGRATLEGELAQRPLAEAVDGEDGRCVEVGERRRQPLLREGATGRVVEGVEEALEHGVVARRLELERSQRLYFWWD